MKVHVELKGRGERREVELHPKATVWDLLRELGLCRETVVVFVDGWPVPEEEQLRSGAKVVILPVVTGG